MLAKMLTAFFTVAIFVWAYWLSPDVGFAGATAVLTFAVSIRGDIQRAKLLRPFFVDADRRPPSFLLEAGVVVMTAAKAIGVGLLALSTLAVADGAALPVGGGVFGVAVLAGAFLAAIVAGAFGGRAHRWALYKLALPMGLIFSAVQVFGEGIDDRLAPPTTVEFFKDFTSETRVLSELIEDFILNIEPNSDDSWLRAAFLNAFRDIQSHYPEQYCTRAALSSDHHAAFLKDNVKEICRTYVEAGGVAQTLSKAVDFSAMLSNFERYIDRTIVELVSPKSYEESSPVLKILVSSSIAQGFVVSVFASVLCGLFAPRRV